MRLRWEHVSHVPNWVAAPYRVNREGDTKPGFLCIHQLENGNGLCASTWFEESTDPHTCVVMLRGRVNLSRPCYDKPHRCPGWAGGGWKSRKHLLCPERDGQSGYIKIDYEDRWWKWKTHRCETCQVVTLPYVVRWFDWYSWWYEVRHIRNHMWFYRLETWWGKGRGKW